MQAPKEKRMGTRDAARASRYFLGTIIWFRDVALLPTKTKDNRDHVSHNWRGRTNINNPQIALTIRVNKRKRKGKGQP
jgi:hypothetical protein